MKKKNIKLLSLVAILFVLLLFDRITKWFAIYYLSNRDINLGCGLRFSLIYNTGISWGLFSGSSQFSLLLIKGFIILFLCIFIAYTIFEWQKQRNIIPHIFIIAGGISNVIDRFLYGAVVDFIVCYIGNWQWPAFNIADMCVVSGILFIFGKIFYQLGR